MIESGYYALWTLSHSKKRFIRWGFRYAFPPTRKLCYGSARAEWGAWRAAFEEPAIHLRIEVSNVIGPKPPSAEFRAHRHLFAFVADAGNFAVCDTRTRTGAAWLTASTVEDAVYFRYYFLEGMAWLFIECLYLTPIHATCVALGSHGVLLCGDSGAGKSTLAYACARRGWTYITDDASYLIRRRNEPVVIGNSHRIRLRPDAARMFPELAGHTPILRGNGKLSLELWTRDLESIVATPSARVDRVIFLERKPGEKARFKPFGKTEARAWCERVLFDWDPEVATEQSGNLSVLLDACEVQALEYSDFDAAVEALSRPS